jgi:hypothetical protein
LPPVGRRWSPATCQASMFFRSPSELSTLASPSVARSGALPLPSVSRIAWLQSEIASDSDKSRPSTSSCPENETTARLQNHPGAVSQRST